MKDFGRRKKKGSLTGTFGEDGVRHRGRKDIIFVVDNPERIVVTPGVHIKTKQNPKKELFYFVGSVT